MIPLFTLPLDQLRAEHVETLRREELPEGQNVEFKRTLAARSGRTAPWLDGGDEVGDHGRNDVLKEVVAFANSGGGNVVLGIVESGDHPKRAMGVNHVPRYDVTFSLDVEKGRAFPLVASDCDAKLPIPELRSGEQVRLKAAITLATGTVFDGSWSWRNEDSTAEERSGRVSL